MGRRLQMVKTITAPSVESAFRWCPIHEHRVYKNVCEERCINKNCPVRKKILKKKGEEERKTFEKLGITRSLLLKNEDRTVLEPQPPSDARG